MIFVTDAAGQCVFVSIDWHQLTGQSIPEALGRGWLQRAHVDDRAIIVQTLEAAVAAASEFTVRFRLLNSQDEPRWVSAGGVPSFGLKDDCFTGYLGSITEITTGATDTISAYGKVERFMPPTPHPNTLPTCKLDMVADHLLLAHSLIEQDGGKNALPALREALFEVGQALAQRNLKPKRLLN